MPAQNGRFNWVGGGDHLTPSESILLKCIAKELAHILQKSEGIWLSVPFGSFSWS